jgi:uncharacterized protein (TIGR03083 family)
VRSRVPADEVLAMFDEGVAAFVAEAGRLDADGWSRPACGEWTATELARHVLTVIGWYHDWLDRAEAGDPSPAFRIDELDERAARSLVEVGDVPGPVATARFAEAATRYTERLEEAWDLPYGYPRGTVTAGLHAGMACVEWHAHTWDLATSAGRDHRPLRPDRLYLVAADCLAAATTGAVSDEEPPEHPWGALLVRSGRR